MSGVTITQGTQTLVKTTTDGGNGDIQHVRPDGGTVVLLSSLTAGTVDTIGLINANAWATVVSTGTNTLGTIKPLVSGSQIFITDITVSVGSASNIVVASGGTSTPIWGTLFFNANGGAISNQRTPLFTTSGSALVYQQSVAGPMTITAGGYVK